MAYAPLPSSYDAPLDTPAPIPTPADAVKEAPQAMADQATVPPIDTAHVRRVSFAEPEPMVKKSPRSPRLAVPPIENMPVAEQAATVPALEASLTPPAGSVPQLSPRSSTASVPPVSPRSAAAAGPPISPRKVAEDLLRRASTQINTIRRGTTTGRELGAATAPTGPLPPKLVLAPEHASQEQVDVTDLVHRMLSDDTRGEAVRQLDGLLDKETNCAFFATADGYSVSAYIIVTGNDQSQTAVLTLLTKLATKMKRGGEMQRIAAALAEYFGKPSLSRLNRLLSLRLLRTVVLAGLPNKEAFVRARGPSTLLPLIQDASAPEPQGLAIFSLGALLAIPSEEDKAAVGARRVIASQIAEQPALLEAVKGALLSRESLILKLSASFMWNYSLSGLMYRKAIAGAGVVPLLVGLIPHHNEEVAWQAAGALRNMILDNEELSLELATQHHIFSIITQRYGTIKANTVKAALLSLLYSLLYGKNEFLHSAFAEAQALPLCVGITRATATEQTETIALAVGILRNHAGNYPASQDAMRESGAIDSGFALLNHEDPQIRENAVSLIWAATSAHPVNQAYVLRSGVLSRILTFLDSPLDLTVTNACAAIRSLCLGHKETQDTLREAGVLPKLIALLARAGLSATKRNPAVAEYACLALHGVVLDNAENTGALLAAGVVSPLASLFHVPSRGLLSAAAMLCRYLLQFSSSPDVLRAVVSAHAVEPITLLLHPRQVEDLRLNCAVILRIVLSDYVTEARPALGELLLVNLGGPSLDPNFHMEILETLSLVGHIPTVQNGARDAGFGGLVALLSSGDAAMQTRAAKCVVKLVQVNGRNQNALLDANCLTPLLALLTHEDMRVAVPACTAIAALTDDVNLWLWNTAVQTRVVEHPDAVHAVIGFCRAPEFEAKEAGLYLMHAVCTSKNKVAQNLVVSNGGPALLVAMLSDPELTPAIITRTLQAIFSVINANPEAITAFKSLGAAGALEAITNRPDQKQRELASQILVQFRKS